MSARETIQDRRSTAIDVLSVLLDAQSDWSKIDRLNPEEKEILTQWAADARVDLTNPSHAGRTKLLEFANETITTLTLGSVKATRDKKANELGIISSNYYNTTFGGGVKNQIKLLGLSKNIVLETVKHPDAFQHLSAPGNFSADSELISLFVKIIDQSTNKNSNNIQWCLVIGTRKSRLINISTAYRIYQDQINFNTAISSPLDLLKAFVERFGIGLRIGGKHIATKFLNYCKLNDGRDIIGWEDTGRSTTGSFMLKQNKDGTVEVALAYAIDDEKYISSLQKHT